MSMRTRVLVSCGSVAGPVFVGTFMVAGRRRAGYSPRVDPVSALALGESGWVQIASFLTTGALTCLAAVGMRRLLRPGPGSTGLPMAIGAVGLGLIGAGVFPTDRPASGYPEPSAGKPASLTRNGSLHIAFSVPFFVGLPVACFIAARRFGGERRSAWARYSMVSGVMAMATSTLAGAGFAGPGRLASRAGTWQRISIVTGLGWMSLFATHLRAEAG